MSKKKLKLVYIKWLDSVKGSGWDIVTDMENEVTSCESVGYIVSNKKESILLVPHILDYNSKSVPQQGCGQMTIPKKAIIKIRELIFSS